MPRVPPKSKNSSDLASKKKMCGLLRPGGPWSVTWGPEAPDSSCGGLIRLAGPWYVLRGPDSFCGALIPPAAP